MNGHRFDGREVLMAISIIIGLIIFFSYGWS